VIEELLRPARDDNQKLVPSLAFIVIEELLRPARDDTQKICVPGLAFIVIEDLLRLARRQNPRSEGKFCLLRQAKDSGTSLKGHAFLPTACQ
jgi:hypothetical protein